MPRKKPVVKRKLDRLLLVDCITKGLSLIECSRVTGIPIKEVGKETVIVLRELAEARVKDRELVVQQKLEEYALIKKQCSEDYENSRIPVQQLFGDVEESSATREENTNTSPPPVGDQQVQRTRLMVLAAERELMGMDYPSLKELPSVHDAATAQQAIDELLPIVKKAMEVLKAKEVKQSLTQALPEVSNSTPIDPILSVPIQDTKIQSPAFNLEEYLSDRMQDGNQ